MYIIVDIYIYIYVYTCIYMLDVCRCLSLARSVWRYAQSPY